MEVGLLPFPPRTDLKFICSKLTSPYIPQRHIFISLDLFYVDVGTICGADYAGEVVKIGPRQDPEFSLQVGDRVAGIVHGGECDESPDISVQLDGSRLRFRRGIGVHKDQGAFAEYVKADAAITWRIPDSISYEEAVTVSVGVLTCIQAMFHPNRLGLAEYPNQVQDQPWVSPPHPGSPVRSHSKKSGFLTFAIQILIYGGSTAVGHFAIQLARLSGFRVVTTASPRNHGLMRRLGAKAVFNVRYFHFAFVLSLALLLTFVC